MGLWIRPSIFLAPEKSRAFKTRLSFGFLFYNLTAAAATFRRGAAAGRLRLGGAGAGCLGLGGSVADPHEFYEEFQVLAGQGMVKVHREGVGGHGQNPPGNRTLGGFEPQFLAL